MLILYWGRSPFHVNFLLLLPMLPPPPTPSFSFFSFFPPPHLIFLVPSSKFPHARVSLVLLCGSFFVFSSSSPFLSINIFLLPSFSSLSSSLYSCSTCFFLHLFSCFILIDNMVSCVRPFAVRLAGRPSCVAKT